MKLCVIVCILLFLNVAGEVIESVTADTEFLQSVFVKEFEKELNAPPGAKKETTVAPVKVTRTMVHFTYIVKSKVQINENVFAL